MLPPFVPIPSADGAVFVHTKQDLNPVCTTPWPKVWNTREDVIVYIEEQIVCVQLADGVVSSEHKFSLPEMFEALCIFFAYGCIFIGGKGGAEKIICIRLCDMKPMGVEHPNILKKYRKSIDDFFVWNELVYAIDNHIHPKYLLGYALEEETWKCVERIKLKGHSAEERVKGGLLWGDTLVLLSRSSHRAGSTTYLSLYPNLVFERYLCWHKTLGSMGVTDITRIRVFQNELLLVTNAGAYLLSKEGTEADIKCVSSESYLVDVYPFVKQPWIGVVSKFGKKKKILIQVNEDDA